MAAFPTFPSLAVQLLFSSVSTILGLRYVKMTCNIFGSVKHMSKTSAIRWSRNWMMGQFPMDFPWNCPFLRWFSCRFALHSIDGRIPGRRSQPVTACQLSPREGPSTRCDWWIFSWKNGEEEQERSERSERSERCESEWILYPPNMMNLLMFFLVFLWRNSSMPCVEGWGWGEPEQGTSAVPSVFEISPKIACWNRKGWWTAGF